MCLMWGRCSMAPGGTEVLHRNDDYSGVAWLVCGGTWLGLGLYGSSHPTSVPTGCWCPSLAPLFTRAGGERAARARRSSVEAYRKRFGHSSSVGAAGSGRRFAQGTGCSKEDLGFSQSATSSFTPAARAKASGALFHVTPTFPCISLTSSELSLVSAPPFISHISPSLAGPSLTHQSFLQQSTHRTRRRLPPRLWLVSYLRSPPLGSAPTQHGRISPLRLAPFPWNATINMAGLRHLRV